MFSTEMLIGCPLDKARQIAEDVCRKVNEYHFVWKDQIFNIGVSIGLVEIGRESGAYVSFIRTDMDWITKSETWGKFDYAKGGPKQARGKNLDYFDAVLFYTNGDTTLSPQQKQGLLDYVAKDGKGFIGIHTAAVTAVNWSEVMSAAAPLLVRAFAGTVPMLLWLSPLIFVLMAASAWLKRLGVPVVLVGSLIAVLVLDKIYGISWPVDALQAWNLQVNTAMVNNPPGLQEALMSDVNLWAWVAKDFGAALLELWSLQFLGWAVLAAAGFALVVMMFDTALKGTGVRSAPVVDLNISPARCELVPSPACA